MEIKELIHKAHSNAVEKGFYDCPECENGRIIAGHAQCPHCNGSGKSQKNIGELLMLIVSELGELLMLIVSELGEALESMGKNIDN